MSRGGNRGGGTTVRRLELQSEKAARELRRLATGAYSGARYRKVDANATATELLEQAADHRLLYLTDDMLTALSWLSETRRRCVSENTQRGLDQLIAALWTAQGQLKEGTTMTFRLNSAKYGVTLYRVKTTGGETRYNYSQVTDNWEDTETENEYRVQVTDAAGFEELAEDDSAIVSYRAL
jgi:hypothetical protein